MQEIDLSNTEKSDQVIWSTSDYQDLVHARYYRCSFCKKGFSNAQALGGHMNIHRKDRARLKESTQNNLSFNIAKKPASAQSPSLLHDEPWQLLESSDERYCTPKRPYTSPREFDPDASGATKFNVFGDRLELGLSVDTPSSSNEKEERNSRGGRHVKRSMRLSRGASKRELDLELRLGPEPQEEATKE